MKKLIYLTENSPEELPMEVVNVFASNNTPGLAKQLYDSTGFKCFKYAYDELKYVKSLKSLFLFCIIHCKETFTKIYMPNCNITQEDVLEVVLNEYPS